MNENDLHLIPLNLPVSVNMRKPPVTVSPSDTASVLMFKMINENIGAVLVVDEEKAVGIVTERDLLKRVIINGKNVYETKAEDVMSKPLISIEADGTIKEALELMREKNIRRLAVTKNKALVGLVTEKRLLSAIVRWGYSM